MVFRLPQTFPMATFTYTVSLGDKWSIKYTVFHIDLALFQCCWHKKQNSQTEENKQQRTVKLLERLHPGNSSTLHVLTVNQRRKELRLVREGTISLLLQTLPSAISPPTKCQNPNVTPCLCHNCWVIIDFNLTIMWSTQGPHSIIYSLVPWKMKSIVFSQSCDIFMIMCFDKTDQLPRR